MFSYHLFLYLILLQLFFALSKEVEMLELNTKCTVYKAQTPQLSFIPDNTLQLKNERKRKRFNLFFVFITLLSPMLCCSEPPPPVGVLGCVAGWRGLGKQSSLAFLQNPLPDLQDPCEANRGVVRGIVPLELRGI